MADQLQDLYEEAMRKMSGNVTNQIRAEHLSGEHIDCHIEFEWTFPNSYVKARLSGILQKVTHNGMVTVEIMGPKAAQKDCMTTPFTIPRDTKVLWTTNYEFMGH